MKKLAELKAYYRFIKMLYYYTLKEWYLDELERVRQNHDDKAWDYCCELWFEYNAKFNHLVKD